MKRLIVTGCSFTNYLPPTWPWFLSEKFEETYNFGKPGAGNEYIFNSLVDADSMLKFNSEDVIIVMWSGFFRIDRSRLDINENWHSSGDISHWPKEDYLYFSHYFSDDLLVKKSVNYILAAYRYLKEKKINFMFSSFASLKDNNKFVSLLDEIYDKHFVIENVSNFVSTNRTYNEVNCKWGHPIAIEHYEIAKIFANRLDLKLDTTFDFDRYMRIIGSEMNFQDNLNTKFRYFSQNEIAERLNYPYCSFTTEKYNSRSLQRLEDFIKAGE